MLSRLFFIFAASLSTFNRCLIRSSSPSLMSSLFDLVELVGEKVHLPGLPLDVFLSRLEVLMHLDEPPDPFRKTLAFLSEARESGPLWRRRFPC